MLSGEFVGRQIGEFRVEELIGEGAMASVYRAYQASMNRSVALKIIRLDQELGHSSEFQRRFAQEAEMIARLPKCRSYRAVVHGDFGFDNLMCLDGRVTGVLDWAEARIGDPLYDLANLDYWSRLPLGDLWRERVRGSDVPDFEDRMIVYLLNIGLGSMVISAHLKDEQDYRRVRDRTLSVFHPGRRRPTDWPPGP